MAVVPPGCEPEELIDGVALTTRFVNAVSTVDVPSVARIVKENVPDALSVPASVQVDPVVPVIQVPFNPVGRVPLSKLQVTVPPKLDAVSV